MHHIQCNECQPQFEICTICNDKEVISNVEFSINIPGGIQNNNTLRLAGAGHYAGQIFNQDKYTDVLVNVTVEPNDYFTIKNQDIVSNLNISLLEALTRLYQNYPDFGWY
jgi:DnaJ-class molecular chaperone